MKNRQIRSWPALKNEFVERRLAGEAISLARFAEEKGIDRRTIERHASKEHWIVGIEARAEARLHEAAKFVNSLYPAFHQSMLRRKFGIR
jgi:hypothetical protein